VRLNLLCWLCAPCIASTVASAALAQVSAEHVRVELRVISSQGASAVIDRGSVDGLARGDRITFRLRDGGLRFGTLRRLEERGAVVDLDDPDFLPLAGTRGEALVPADRFVLAAPESAAPTPPTREHPPWTPRADEWTQEQPLLARVRPLRPAERPASVRGRLYMIADWTHSGEDDRSAGFYRAGGELWIENPTGRGERIHFDGELNYRNTDVTDGDDDTSSYLRIDRASYTVGGNRFQPDRYGFGRMLHDNLPELGLLDGIEWSRRLDSGDRLGLSAGFQPENDPAQSSIEDFQVSISYRWIYDDSEQLSAAAAFQKTLHQADGDRDLVIGKFQYLPGDGWSVHSVGWFDFYTTDDANKGEGIEVTQALLSAGKRWADGSALHAVYSHIAFPELKRDDNLPVTAAQLAHDHNDRLALHPRLALSDSTRLHGTTAVWVDQNDEGSDHLLGVEFDDLFAARSVIDLAGFATDAKFVQIVGARASFSRSFDLGRWGFEYELANSRFVGFSSNNDDLAEHRLRLFTDLFLSGGFNLAVHVDTFLWDDENSLSAGFYLQKNF